MLIVFIIRWKIDMALLTIFISNQMNIQLLIVFIFAQEARNTITHYRNTIYLLFIIFRILFKWLNSNRWHKWWELAPVSIPSQDILYDRFDRVLHYFFGEQFFSFGFLLRILRYRSESYRVDLSWVDDSEVSNLIFK